MAMLRLAVKRGFSGVPLGIFISYIITVIISVAIGDGYYHPVVPALADQFGSEINAVVFQAVMAGFQGAAAGAASVIWNLERWSLAKQGGIYFIVLAAITFPTAYLAHWIQRTAAGVLLYIAGFVVIYVIICTINYVVWRAQIKKINSKMPQKLMIL